MNRTKTDQKSIESRTYVSQQGPGKQKKKARPLQTHIFYSIRIVSWKYIQQEINYAHVMYFVQMPPTLKRSIIIMT